MRVCMHIGCHVIGLSDRMMFGVVRVHFVMSLYVRGACLGLAGIAEAKRAFCSLAAAAGSRALRSNNYRPVYLLHRRRPSET